MNPVEVRNWIGKYFLIVLAVVAGYIYIFAETVLLPLTRAEAMAAGETIIPVLMGQLAIIYKWFFTEQAVDVAGEVDVPSWLIKWPPFVAIGLVAASIVSLIVSNLYENRSGLDPESFRRIVVFAVGLLNVTTVIVITKYFGLKSAEEPGK